MADLVSCYDSKRIYTFYHEAKELLAGKMPKPRMCLLYPSRLCTQNCFYCSDRWGNKEINKFMPTEQLLGLPKKLRDFGLESVELCGGGEPLFHPQINEFIKGAASEGLKIASLTNGTMIRGELAETIVKHLSYIRVSLDTFNPDLYNQIRKPKDKKYGLEAVLGNIKELIQTRKRKKPQIQIGAKICLTQDNLDEIINSVKIAQEIGFDSIQIKFARHTGKKEMSPLKLEKAKKDFEYCKQNFKNILVMASVDKYVLDHKCWLCPFHLFIDTNGDVRLCCYFQFRKKRHTFGNVFRSSIDEVWYSKKHFEALKNIKLDECNRWDCKYFIYNRIMKEAVIEDKAQWQFV